MRLAVVPPQCWRHPHEEENTLVKNSQNLFRKFKYPIFFFFFFAPTDFDNLLADRPAPPGGAGGAGGGPPCNSKNTTFRIFKRKGNYRDSPVSAVSISEVFDLVRFTNSTK